MLKHIRYRYIHSSTQLESADCLLENSIHLSTISLYICNNSSRSLQASAIFAHSSNMSSHLLPVYTLVNRQSRTSLFPKVKLVWGRITRPTLNSRERASSSLVSRNPRCGCGTGHGFYGMPTTLSI